MAYTNIDKGSDYFNTVLYSGNSSTQSITGVNFKPDFVWIKKRSGVDGSRVFDIVRGASQGLFTDSTSAEATVSSEHTSFDTDGFTLGSSENVNGSGETYASWSWLASNTTASNTDGSITSTVSANTTSGFSICTFTQASSGSFTFGHGLGVAPDMVIGKSRGSVSNWQVYHKSLGTGAFIQLNTTGASQTVSNFWGTIDTSIVTVGSNQLEASQPSVYYCFAEKKGFSKFGSYTGNGSTDGTFVYTGFTPAFVMVKQSSTSGNGWIMMDNKRNTFNPNGDFLQANTSDAEDTSSVDCDFLSNGFKMKTTSGRVNTSGATYIYMCFAENPLVSSSGVPCTAR